MNMLLSREKENLATYEGLAPGRGELLYALMRDDVIDFKKHYKKTMKDTKIADTNLLTLLVESNSFNCILFFKDKENEYFKKSNICLKKTILMKLFLANISLEEKDIFVKKFLKGRFSQEEKIQLYLTALIYAPSTIFNTYFEKFNKWFENKHFDYIIRIFNDNHVLGTKNYLENEKRLHLVYEEFIKLGKRRNMNWLHYVNSMYLGSDNEIFRNEFFEYLPHKEKMCWINYLFKNMNLIYHSTILAESLKEKYTRKRKKEDIALNLDFVIFIFDNIISYIASNDMELTKLQIKKLILFREKLNYIAKNIFLFESVTVFQDLNNYIHEWTLKKEIKSRNKNLSHQTDRKKKKI